MIGKDQIAEAMRNTDAISEEHEDMPRFWRERGVDPEGVMYCAMQHGLRHVMIQKGMNPNQPRSMVVSTTPAEQATMIKFAGAWMSGFAASFEILRKDSASL